MRYPPEKYPRGFERSLLTLPLGGNGRLYGVTTVQDNYLTDRRFIKIDSFIGPDEMIN